MASLDRIGTQGFKRWHERQLIESHAWLVTCLLAAIAAASGVELLASHGPAHATGLMLILAGAAIMLFAWQRYWNMFAVAERLSSRAVCPGCRRYSRFRVLACGPTPLPEYGDQDIEVLSEEVWFRVECGCGRKWSL